MIEDEEAIEHAVKHRRYIQGNGAAPRWTLPIPHSGETKEEEVEEEKETYVYIYIQHKINVRKASEA